MCILQSVDIHVWNVNHMNTFTHTYIYIHILYTYVAYCSLYTFDFQTCLLASIIIALSTKEISRMARLLRS